MVRLHLISSPRIWIRYWLQLCIKLLESKKPGLCCHLGVCKAWIRLPFQEHRLHNSHIYFKAYWWVYSSVPRFVSDPAPYLEIYLRYQFWIQLLDSSQIQIWMHLIKMDPDSDNPWFRPELDLPSWHSKVMHFGLMQGPGKCLQTWWGDARGSWR